MINKGFINKNLQKYYPVFSKSILLSLSKIITSLTANVKKTKLRAGYYDSKYTTRFWNEKATFLPFSVNITSEIGNVSKMRSSYTTIIVSNNAKRDDVQSCQV